MIKIIGEEELDFPDENFNEKVAISFAEDLLNILNELTEESDYLNEDFVSAHCRNVHYNKHCLGKNTNKISKRTNVYYDFNDQSKYIDYEKKISSLIEKTKYNISSLYDYDLIISYLKKLFLGSITIRFNNSCELKNNNGSINLSLHAFSSDVTENYKEANTIDICIKNLRDRTITLFPVDSYYLQTKLNNIFKKYSSYTGKDFKYNVK